MRMRKIGWMVTISSMASFLICLLRSGRVHDSLFITVFYPLLYLMVSVPLLGMLSNKYRGGRITVSIFLLLQWIRFVLLPTVSVVGGYFSTVSDIADDSSARIAAILGVFELIATSFFCFIILKYSKKQNPDSTIAFSLSGNRRIYLLFAAAMFLLFLFRGRDMFTFLMLSSNVSSRASLAEGNLVLQALIEYGLICFMIVSLYYCYDMSRKTAKNRYVWLALILSMIRICIISTESESRMAILYSVGALIFLLPRLFPSDRKKIVVSIFAIGLTVIGLLTIYKTFRAFRYGSYVEAIVNGKASTGLNNVSYTIDSYFYGVKDIARNIYISKQTGLTYKNLIADVVQNIFGLKYLIPSTGNTTISAYNYYIYNGGRNSGHLYSALAYGYCYFGVILAPLATCVNILIAAFFERLLSKLKSLDSLYVFCLVFVRSAASMFACFPLTLNYASRSIVLGAIVVGGASVFKRHRNSVQKGRSAGEAEKGWSGNEKHTL